MLDFDSIFTKKKDTTDSSRTHRIGAREVKEEKLLSEGTCSLTKGPSGISGGSSTSTPKRSSP